MDAVAQLVQPFLSGSIPEQAIMKQKYLILILAVLGFVLPSISLASVPQEIWRHTTNVPLTSSAWIVSSNSTCDNGGRSSTTEICDGYVFHSTTTAYLYSITFGTGLLGNLSNASSLHFDIYDEQLNLIGRSVELTAPTSSDFFATSSFQSGFNNLIVANATYTINVIVSGSPSSTYVYHKGSATDPGGFNIYGTVDPYPPNVTMAFPVSGSIWPDFSSWIVNVSNATTGDVIGVAYGQNTLQFQDYKNYSSLNPFTIPKSRQLSVYGVSSTWNFAPYVIRGSSTYVGALGTFEIDLNATGTPPNGTYGFNTGFVPPYVGSSTYICDNASTSWNPFNGDNYAYVGCVIIDRLFHPQTAFSQNYIQNQITGFKSVFPFNIFFSFADSVSGDAVAFNASTSDMALVVPANTFPSSPEIPILTSSTLVNAVGQTRKNQIFLVISNILWLGLGGVIVKMIL